MVTTNEILNEFEAATYAYMHAVKLFSQQQINEAPYEGCWTAAQITDHIFQSDNAVLKALHGPSQPANRPPDQGIDNLKAIFLDFSTKLKSPDFIIPDNIEHDKENLVSAFKSQRELIGKAIKTLDLTATVSMPIFGEPTRLELISFVIFHTQRHTNQVRNIYEKLVHA
jgi:hypothetical protein